MSQLRVSPNEEERMDMKEATRDMGFIRKLQYRYAPIHEYKKRGSLFHPEHEHAHYIEAFHRFFWANIVLVGLVMLALYVSPKYVVLPLLVMYGIQHTKKTMEWVMCNGYPHFEPMTMLGLLTSLMMIGLVFLGYAVWVIWFV
jgi:hypothetical protein